jgi:membrane protein DedA with SNARE-associated domain
VPVQPIGTKVIGARRLTTGKAMGQFILIALATFVSEDLTCIATGALIASGMLGFLPGVLACVAGIFFGDLLLYFAGRLLGRPILRWKPLRKVLSEQKLDLASQWLAERGASVVIFSRFTPGLRLPTYVAAGVLKTRFWTFTTYFLLAALIWTPVLVGAAALLGRSLPHLAFLGPAILLVGVSCRTLRWGRCFWQTRRRMIGWIRRKTRWEFWPPWLAYIPVVPYVLYLGIRHRSFTLFTAANPGIPSGGFVGESKAAILSSLDLVPDFLLLSGDLPTDARIALANEFMIARKLSYPIVLKPDVGERGTGVSIARNDDELRSYLKGADGNTIVQKYIGGLEFGIFYYRYPGESQGRIFSITEKHFPSVVGDGSSSIKDLILRDERAVCLADMYMGRLKRPADDVPAAGESITLAELGSHCRGSVFLNGASLLTAALSDAVDKRAQSHAGFYFGRFDVRSPSVKDLQAGGFEVLELNGVSAEPTHIYDPSVSLLEAYRTLFGQWKIAFEIGAMNRRDNVNPMPLREFLTLIRRRHMEVTSEPASIALRAGGQHGTIRRRGDWQSAV